MILNFAEVSDSNIKEELWMWKFYFNSVHGYGTTQQPEIRLLINSAAIVALGFPISLGLWNKDAYKL